MGKVQKTGGSVVRVLVPLALPTMLDYRTDLPAKAGTWVDVPVGRQGVHGVVAEVLESSPFGSLKTARVMAEVPPLSLKMLEFYRWAGRYTLSAPGEPLRVAMPRAKVPKMPKVGGKTLQKAAKSGGGAAKVVLNAAQKAAEAAIGGKLGQFAPFLLDGVTGSGKTEVYFDVVEKVLAAGKQVLVLVPEIALTPQWLKRFEQRFGEKPLVWHSGLAEGARRRTWWELAERNEERGSEERGVAARAILTSGATTPEARRFAKTNGNSVVGDAGGGSTMEGAGGEAGGRGRVVVGARSALFLPFSDLGLVVVDEEHEPSYKQEEAFRYNARDLAVQLAKIWSCPVVLASATPSLESWQRALEGKYTRLVLPDRVGDAGMAKLVMVDLREGGTRNEERGSEERGFVARAILASGAPAPAPAAVGQKEPSAGLREPSVRRGLKRGEEFVSGVLMRAMAETLARGEQSLLFLNRRGNAPVLICRECGARRDCPRCDATLVVHGDKLQCHHCGLSEPFPDECAVCGGTDMRPYGPGTRRVVQEVQKAFPQARVEVADSDAVRTPKQLSELVRAVEAREVDIIVGTQMVTKGHHFPHLTCVGVIDADMGLAHGDLRAAERTYQLLTQVAGRAGRGSAAGTVYVQSFDPEQPLFKALLNHDRDGFYALELEARKAWGDPPFGRLVAVIVDGLDEADVVEGARGLARGWEERGTRNEVARLLGPAPAPVAKIRDRYRWRLLVKGPGVLQGIVKSWVESTAVPKGVRVVVDVDPVSFM
ncbi:MAG: primosomal protein N' [Proteobacteria bacterium]|nr:primosomal protein N' [Pseudomonadota bacterium]